MVATVSWAAEFARVISCQVCSSATHRDLLRDDGENIPQPGYIGSRYWNRRVLLVGQNPGTPKTLEADDKPYTLALRRLRDAPTDATYGHLMSVLRDFIPRWPVHGNYFPLEDAGLTLDDVAYFNVVRCRTSADAKPSSATVANCVNVHFGRWLDHLSPRVVIFIGKWAADKAATEVRRRGIPCTFINRQRSLSAAGRRANRDAVVRLVRASDA